MWIKQTICTIREKDLGQFETETKRLHQSNFSCVSSVFLNLNWSKSKKKKILCFSKTPLDFHCGLEAHLEPNKQRPRFGVVSHGMRRKTLVGFFSIKNQKPQNIQSCKG